MLVTTKFAVTDETFKRHQRPQWFDKNHSIVALLLSSTTPRHSNWCDGDSVGIM